MKTVSIFLLTSFLGMIMGCKSSDNSTPTPTVVSTPSFNQINTAFGASQVQCLLSQWYNRRYQNEPIVFRAINDSTTYAAFFACNSTTSLPTIDFTSNTLLVGMKADYGNFINTPVNITNIVQNLLHNSNDTYTLQVQISGQSTSDGKGGEWFAFTSLVPKIKSNSSVNLAIQYQFK